MSDLTPSEHARIWAVADERGLCLSAAAVACGHPDWACALEASEHRSLSGTPEAISRACAVAASVPWYRRDNT